MYNRISEWIFPLRQGHISNILSKNNQKKFKKRKWVTQKMPLVVRVAMLNNKNVSSESQLSRHGHILKLLRQRFSTEANSVI